MKVSIIIPNYNGENLLKQNLPYVFEAADYYKEETKQEIEIIIVDDCSTDNSIQVIQNFRPEDDRPLAEKLKIVINERNLGFSSSINKGVQEAGGDIVVLINTDVRPEEDFLISLVKHFSDEAVFAVGCMDKSIENGKVVLRGRGVGRWKRGFLVHLRGEVDKNDTLWVSGGSGAFRRSIWKTLGGFSPLFNPFYWEDIDLSYRALKSGYKILFEPKSIVIHEHEKGIILNKYSKSQINSIAYRNQIIFVWKNITDVSFIIQHIFWLPYHFLKALKSGNYAFFQGFFSALTMLPQVIQSIFADHRYFIRKDQDII